MTGLYPKLVEWDVPVILRFLWGEWTTFWGEVLKIWTFGFWFKF